MSNPRNISRRSTLAALMLPAVVLLVACSGAADTGQAGGGTGDNASSDGGSGDGTSSDTSGVVFKGPMEIGGVVKVTPYGPDLEPIGSPVEATVAEQDGSFSVLLDHQGLVKIEATGTVFNEAKGEIPDDIVTLRAWGEVGDRTVLQVNVLTDGISVRVGNKLSEGMVLTDAIEEAEQEFHSALGWDDRPEPDADGASLDPYGGDYEAAWLFAVSSVVARAGEQWDEDERGELTDFLAFVREGFGATGEFHPDVRDAMEQAERTMDPDLATLGLQTHMDDNALPRPVPVIHQALDTDGDGILNADDNCRYAVNPDQTPLEGTPFGAACDDRLLDVSTGEAFGCALTSASGELVCWSELGAITGGAPPHPETFPVYGDLPWDIDGLPSPFAATGYAQFEIRTGAPVVDSPPQLFACGVWGDGRTDCWYQGLPPFQLPALVSEIRLAREQVCAHLSTGGLACYDFDGTPSLTLLGNVSDFTVRPTGGVCSLDDVGALSCVDGLGLPEADDFSDTYSAIAANPSGDLDLVCALTAGDGSIECHGETDPAGWTDGGDLFGGSGYVGLTVGRGVICAHDAAGTLECAYDQMGGDGWDACPVVEQHPVVATGLTAEGCKVCGIDDNGFGSCWPRMWNQQHPPPMD